MSIYDSLLWNNDLRETIATLPELGELAGKRVMITGCRGLICSAVIDLFITWNNNNSNKIVILAAGRNEKAIVERFAPYDKEDWFIFIPYNAASMDNSMSFQCDYIIHGASNASPNKIMKEPVETLMSNFVGVKCLLDYARAKNIKRLLYISSSEVYGRKNHDKPYRTDDYGSIDILDPRNSYSIGKCAAETLCVSYYEEYKVESVIVRPGHIYGPTAVESDRRVSSEWAYAVARGQDIVMKSDGLQVRSYCYCLDCASAIIKVLLRGEKNHAYNISNPESIIKIRSMAEFLTKSAGVKLVIEQPTEEEKKRFNPMSNSSLDSSELLALGWKARFDALTGFSHTVRILRESNTL